MKQLTKTAYETPQIKVFQVNSDRGFAASSKSYMSAPSLDWTKNAF